MNTEQNDAGAQLAYAALDEVPTPAADAKTITGVVKSRGRIKGYQLSDGNIVSKEEGVSMAKAGQIKGVGVAHRRDTEYLKALPDENETNNLSSLPSVSADIREES